MQFDPSEHPHRRFNPLTRSWVLVSPHRAKRPWQGSVGEEREEEIPDYEPTCYLCPRNDRAGGAVTNPDYTDTFVYDNDFPSLLTDSPSGETNDRDLLIADYERGICRVICYTPKHNMRISLMSEEKVKRVIDVWTEQFQELGAIDYINHVQIFENREGNSSPHAHCQVWATERVPDDPATITRSMKLWHESKGSDLLGDYLAVELEKNTRVISSNDHFSLLAPFWAVWPYEMIAIPHRRVSSLLEMSEEERGGLASIMRELTIRCDNLFQAEFPYSMGIRQAPTDGDAHPEWRLHLHFTSSVLRSPTIPKFMVGYERLGEPQRDFTPEYAAQRLREASSDHYRSRP